MDRIGGAALARFPLQTCADPIQVRQILVRRLFVIFGCVEGRPALPRKRVLDDSRIQKQASTHKRIYRRPIHQANVQLYLIQL